MRSANLHHLAEERSIALHAAVAVELESRPEVLEQAKSRVDRWLRDGTVAATYASDWKALLSLPREQLKARLIGRSERMRALRQCSPFAGALDPRTRWRIHKDTASRMLER